MTEGYSTRLYLNPVLRGSRRVRFRSSTGADARVSESALLAGPRNRVSMRWGKDLAVLQAYCPSHRTSEIDSNLRFVKIKCVSLVNRSGDSGRGTRGYSTIVLVMLGAISENDCPESDDSPSSSHFPSGTALSEDGKYWVYLWYFDRLVS